MKTVQMPATIDATKALLANATMSQKLRIMKEILDSVQDELIVADYISQAAKDKIMSRLDKTVPLLSNSQESIATYEITAGKM